MNAAARLAAFGALLAVVFAAAAFAGDVIDADRGDAPASHATGDLAPALGDAAHGTEAPSGTYALRLRRTRGALALRVVDAAGETLRDFDVSHERELHLIVVRRDLTRFQHLHPARRADGSWSTPLRLGAPGSYRVFADFETAGEKQTPSADLQVDGAVESAPLPEPTTTATVDGYDVALKQQGQEFSFAVTRDGAPVALEDYLGAQGHLVALRADDLEYAHVHAEEDELAFAAALPSAGRYRLFLQFQVDGRVRTVAFTVDA